MAYPRRTPNYRAAFRAGLPLGMAAAGLAWLSGGRVPWGRLAQRDERTCLRTAAGPLPPRAEPDEGPHDLGLDSDLYLAHLRHLTGAEHIEIRDAAACRECFRRYAAPCARFCRFHASPFADPVPGHKQPFSAAFSGINAIFFICKCHIFNLILSMSFQRETIQ